MDSFNALCEEVDAAVGDTAHYGAHGLTTGGISPELFLNDLVDARAWVPRDLKRRFLEIWSTDEEIIHADPDERDGITHQLVVEFAAIEPVIDLGPDWA
ncbi:hypothetical protein ACFORJ_05445 [Corynebacterium hansenii]|uniref:Uncharacterized protein n=1 Tax=Corynebacterium hansenii TaxID=394964 RepID=A0ABV7ZP99_9CORY|nr:hypothetical protein [Corynebacterium hansenii]WJZ00186.1 hypothetical protein CHAN_07885 [Corynebacterium hansenii]